MCCIVRNKFDKTFWTSSDTFATSLTFVFIYYCYTVNYMDCIEWTSLYTRAISKTSIVTRFWTATWNECHSSTIFNTSVFIINFCFFTSTSTFNESNFLNACASIYTHNFTNFCFCLCIGNRTAVYRSLTLCNGRCQIGCIIVGEVRCHGKFAGFRTGERVSRIFNELCLLNSFLDQKVQTLLRCGGIDEEGGMAPEAAVVHINGHFLVGIVGVADRIETALDEEQLVTFPPVNVDFIITDPFMGL